MKAKTKFFVFLIGLLFVLGFLWMISHSYVVVTFWLGLKILGVLIASHFFVFWVGRWTHPHDAKPPQQ